MKYIFYTSVSQTVGVYFRKLDEGDEWYIQEILGGKTF